MELTQAYLKSILHYDPDTGVFVRLVRTANCLKAGDIADRPANHGYTRVCINYKYYLSHRLAFLYMTGAFPSEQTDHINHVRNDNRWRNLRAVTSEQNLRNASLGSKNTSGVVGVTRNNKCEKWQAQVWVGGKNVYLGLFDTIPEATAARQAANIKYGFHENHGGYQ